MPGNTGGQDGLPCPVCRLQAAEMQQHQKVRQERQAVKAAREPTGRQGRGWKVAGVDRELGPV